MLLVSQDTSTMVHVKDLCQDITRIVIKKNLVVSLLILNVIITPFPLYFNYGGSGVGLRIVLKYTHIVYSLNTLKETDI